MKKMLLFEIGTMTYGIDLSSVKSIKGMRQIVPGGAESIGQLTSAFDDKQTPLYDLVAIFEKEIIGRDSENEKLVMVEADGQTMGMIVSRVDQIVTLDSDAIKSISPIFKGASMSCFPEVLKYEDKLILLLAPEGIARVIQETDNSPDISCTPVSGHASTEDEEIITLIDEVSIDSSHSHRSPVDRPVRDLNVNETLEAEGSAKFESPAEDVEIEDGVLELLDAADLADESQCESGSFLENFLQTAGSAASKPDPADS